MKKRSIQRAYGYIPDLGDSRDLMFSVSRLENLPERRELLNLMPPVYDQGKTGSCVGQATAAAHWVCSKKQMKDAPGVLGMPTDPSRLFIYYEARRLRGMERMDRGCYIRDAIKTLVNKGVCPESDWPFLVKNVCERPSRVCYAEALHEQVLSYYRVSNSVLQMRQCIAEGYPIVIGVSLYESFEGGDVKRTGLVPMPDHSDRMIGGHAMLVIGYDAMARTFTVRNSWGTDWGINGYCFFPEDYLANQHLCTDCWTLREVE